MKTVRVLVVDDHEVVRHGVRDLLEAEPDLRICCEASDGREAVEKALALRPDVVVLDIGLPGMSGFEATRRIREAAPEIEVLVLTMHESEQAAREAWAAGARGFVLKSDAGRQLVLGVRSLARHRPFLCRRFAHLMAELRARPPRGILSGASLTAREREVLRLVAQGKNTRQIAAALDVRPKTVEAHRTNLMRKLDIHKVADLVRYAIRSRLIEP